RAGGRAASYSVSRTYLGRRVIAATLPNGGRKRPEWSSRSCKGRDPVAATIGKPIAEIPVDRMTQMPSSSVRESRSSRSLPGSPRANECDRRQDGMAESSRGRDLLLVADGRDHRLSVGLRPLLSRFLKQSYLVRLVTTG